MRSKLLKVIVGLLVAVVVGYIVAAQISLSAIPEPGPWETRFATAGKRWVVKRAAQREVGAAPGSDAASVDNGNMLYGMDCDSCHGKDGRHPTETGQWMSPRVVNLGGPEVQGWSDAELFWIVKNGVKFSGMPAFGKTQSDKEIWDLVHYVRSLGAPAAPSK